MVEEINTISQERDEVKQLYFENQAEYEVQCVEDVESLKIDHEREIEELKCEFGNTL
jgi:hypothetical protein